MDWKFATFNVNGIRARLPIVLQWLKDHEPHVLCMQEIKSQEKDFPMAAFQEAGYVVSLRGQKSFNGVAIACRAQPEEILYRLDDEDSDDEARFIAAKVDGVWVVNTYVPQGRSPEHPAFQFKLAFLARLKRWFQEKFEPDSPLVWAGDINVAPEASDVFDPQRLEGEVGFHPDERAALEHVKAWGLVDLYRKHHPSEKQFTFWDYRLPMSFKRNLGWRLDHIWVTEPMAKASVDCSVDTQPRGLDKPSDHTPVWAVFNLSHLRSGA